MTSSRRKTASAKKAKRPQKKRGEPEERDRFIKAKDKQMDPGNEYITITGSQEDRHQQMKRGISDCTARVYHTQSDEKLIGNQVAQGKNLKTSVHRLHWTINLWEAMAERRSVNNDG